MQPVYHNAESDLESAELLNVEFEAKLGLKVTKYVAIDYSFKAYRQPLIINEWQIQNNLLVSIGFELPSPQPPPTACPEAPPCPECPPPPTAPSPAPTKTAPGAPESEGQPAPPESTPPEAPKATSAPEEEASEPTKDTTDKAVEPTTEVAE